MTFRDDDTSYLTNLKRFTEVHELFIKYGVIHTIAVICKDIEKNPELIAYINKHRDSFDIQIHCWEHTPMPENTDLACDLQGCINAIQYQFGTKPTTVYPPWNRSDEYVGEVAESLGLIVSNTKTTLSAYVRTMGGVEEDVINFHSWCEPEVMLIEPALKIYKRPHDKNICQ